MFRAEGWGFLVGLDEEDLALSYVSSFLVSVPLVLLLELFFADESFLDSSRWGKIFLRWGFVDMVLDLCGSSRERGRLCIQLMKSAWQVAAACGPFGRLHKLALKLSRF